MIRAGEHERLWIFCTSPGCGPGAQAMKVRIQARPFGDRGRVQWWWGNRCLRCSTVYAAPAPGHARKARGQRAYRRKMQELERRGQGRLF